MERMDGLLDRVSRPSPIQRASKPAQRYSSPSRVKQAYNSGLISYGEAQYELVTFFGFSDTDAQEYLSETTIDPVTPGDEPGQDLPIGPPVFPGDFDGDGVADEDDANPSDPGPEGGRLDFDFSPESIEPKDFRLIGLIVFASLGYYVFR